MEKKNPVTTQNYLNTAAGYSRKSPASVGWRRERRKPWGTGENSLQATNWLLFYQLLRARTHSWGCPETCVPTTRSSVTYA